MYLCICAFVLRHGEPFCHLCKYINWQLKLPVFCVLQSCTQAVLYLAVLYLAALYLAALYLAVCMPWPRQWPGGSAAPTCATCVNSPSNMALKMSKGKLSVSTEHCLHQVHQQSLIYCPPAAASKIRCWPVPGSYLWRLCIRLRRAGDPGSHSHHPQSRWTCDAIASDCVRPRWPRQLLPPPDPGELLSVHGTRLRQIQVTSRLTVYLHFPLCQVTHSSAYTAPHHCVTDRCQVSALPSTPGEPPVCIIRWMTLRHSCMMQRMQTQVTHCQVPRWTPVGLSCVSRMASIALHWEETKYFNVILCAAYYSLIN